MSFSRRVFVSTPDDKPLTEGHRALKSGIIKKIEEVGYGTEIFNIPDQGAAWPGTYHGALATWTR